MKSRYTGSYALMRDHLRSARPRPGPIAPPPPSVRAVTGWLTRHPDTLAEDEQVQLKTIVEQCPELCAAAGHIRAFGELLTKLRGQDLPAWIAAVRADNLPGLASFCGPPGTRPGRGDVRADDTVELRPGRRPREPHQNA